MERGKLYRVYIIIQDVSITEADRSYSKVFPSSCKKIMSEMFAHLGPYNVNPSFYYLSLSRLHTLLLVISFFRGENPTVSHKGWHHVDSPVMTASGSPSQRCWDHTAQLSCFDTSIHPSITETVAWYAFLLIVVEIAHWAIQTQSEKAGEPEVSESHIV